MEQTRGDSFHNCSYGRLQVQLPTEKRIGELSDCLEACLDKLGLVTTTKDSKFLPQESITNMRGGTPSVSKILLFHYPKQETGILTCKKSCLPFQFPRSMYS